MAIELPEIVIIGQLPESQSRAKQMFKTMDQAALAAIDEILPVSTGNGIEYSGAIVQNLDKTFSFTYAETLDDPTASNANPNVPPGKKLVAIYHTHPSDQGNGQRNAENFSVEDVMTCRFRTPPVIFYLGTPSGKIKKLIPPGLLGGADKEKFGIFGKQTVLREGK